MTAIAILAQREFADGIRNRWIVIISLVMAGLSLILSLLGSTPTGATKISILAVMIVSLSSLSIFFVPLIALMLSCDSITTERERGTLLLLLSYPLTRWQVVLGKFLGQMALLSLAIGLGYGIAGLTIALNAPGELRDQAWWGFAGLIASSILLGAVFLALGLLISTTARERGTAAGIAIAVWLVFAILYDLGLISLLSSGIAPMIDQTVMVALLLGNPTDIYRILNLAGTTDAAILSGMAGLTAESSISHAVLTGLLFAWVIAPLGAACLVFERKAL